MTRLVWLDRPYEVGLDRGVLYPKNAPAEVWNGLRSVEEVPDRVEGFVRYIDGVPTQRGRSPEGFTANVSAFSCPNVLNQNLRSRQRPTFDFAYRVQTDSGSKLHMVYNATFIPSSLNYEQKAPADLTWGVFTTPSQIPGAKPSAHLVIDTSCAYSSVTTLIEEILYGTDADVPRMPSPAELNDIFEANSILRVVDHGDGTFTIIGPDSAIQMLDATTFQINWPSAVYINAATYTIKSL